MESDEIGLKYQYFFLAESHVFYIAILIITIVGVLLILYFPTDEKVAQGVFTAIITWIGSIVGFYFGSKPVSDVVTRLQSLERDISQRNTKVDRYIELKDEYKTLLYKTIVEAKELNGKE